MQIKKLLLTLLTLVCTVLAGQAETLTFDFTDSNKNYGLTNSSYPTEETSYPMTGTTGSNESITSNFTFFKCGWTKSSSNSFIHLPSANGTSAYFYIQVPSGYKVTGLRFYTTNASVSIKGSAKFYADDVLVATVNQPAKGQWSNSPELSNLTAINTIKIQNAQSVQFSLGKIELTVEPAITPEDVMFEWDQTGTADAPYKIDINDANKAYPEFTAIGSNGTTEFDATKVSYTSSNPEVLNVDAATGAMTALTAGTTTVTANFAGDTYFNAFSSPIVIQVTGKNDIAPVTITPGVDADFFPNDKITFNCATADSKLFYTIKEGETVLKTNTEGGVAMPFEYAFPKPATYTVVCHAENALYNTIADQTFTYTVKPLMPTAPEFSVAAGSVPYNSQVSISARNVENFEYTIAYTNKEKADETKTVAAVDGACAFNVEYDCTVTVIGKGKWGDSEAACATYTVQRPTAPTFDREDMSDVEQGEYLTITAAEGCKVRYQVNDGQIVNADANPAKYQIVEDITISAWSVLPNGYTSTESTDALYSMVAPHKADTPTASQPNGEALSVGSSITFTVPEADRVYVTKYAYDGSPIALPVSEGTIATVTFDKDYRRFTVYGVRDVYGDNDGTGPTLDVMYNVQAGYRRVADASQLKAGMEFVFAVPEKSVIMSQTPNNKKGTTWKPTTYLFGTQPDIITDCPVDAMKIKLEATGTPNVWYLKSLSTEYPGYLCQTNSGKDLTTRNQANELSIKPEPTKSAITFDGTSAKIIFAVEDGIIQRVIKYNSTSSIFNMQLEETEFSLVSIYAVEEAVEEAPVVTFKHRRFDWRGFHDPETEHATEAVTDAEGVTTYTAQGVYNLAGDFKLFMNGTALGGHPDQAKTDFAEGHGYAELNGTNCVGEHAPYVFVEQNTAYTLQTAKEGQVFLPLSTSPDRYHYGNYVHTNPVVKVMHKPFHILQLMVEGEAGGTVTSVANVAVDADAPVMLFNLQGQPVDPAHAAPGIYLRRQGSRTDKVVIE